MSYHYWYIYHLYIYTYYCIFIHKAIKGAIRHGTRAGAFSLVYIANTFIYALVRLYLYIIILFFYLKNSYMHSLIIIAFYIISYCLSYAKSKLCILCLSHARGGSGGWGVFGGSGGFYPLIGRFVDGRRAFGADCVRVRACFPVRAGVRGYAPTIFCARPIPGSLPPHSVRRICGGISRVWCDLVRLSVFIA